MKKLIALFMVLSLMLLCQKSLTGQKLDVEDDVELVCMRKHSASGKCYFNFKINGMDYQYIDIGCKTSNRNKLIEKVKKGKVALSKDWEYPCPEKK